MSLVAEAFVTQLAAAEPWPENAALYQQLKEEQILLSDNASSLAVQAFLQMCNLPIQVVCRANAEYMSPSGKVPFIHVGNQVVSELGPIVQFVKAKGHSLSDGLDEVQKAEMKAYMELVNNMLLTAELYLQWCDDVTVEEITHPRYGSPYPWPLNRILSYQKQWEVRRKMKAIGWAGKTLEQVLEDVDQCCQALSQRLGTQPYFFNKQPTELDALVFGHLFTILTTQLTTDELSEKELNRKQLRTSDWLGLSWLCGSGTTTAHSFLLRGPLSSAPLENGAELLVPAFWYRNPTGVKSTEGLMCKGVLAFYQITHARRGKLPLSCISVLKFQTYTLNTFSN